MSETSRHRLSDDGLVPPHKLAESMEREGEHRFDVWRLDAEDRPRRNPFTQSGDLVVTIEGV